MDLQKIMDDAVAAGRKKTLAKSTQLTLGEMVLKMEAIVKECEAEKIDSHVHYDFGHLFPTTINSWRGSYCELALDYDSYDGGGIQMSAKAFHELLKETVGKTFEGYKGGGFTMSRQTPVWVANYGNSGETAVVDIVKSNYGVIIKTAHCEY